MANYRERLRGLAVHDPQYVNGGAGAGGGIADLDGRTLSLARLASLIAVGGSQHTFGEYADAALSAGATCDEIVDVLTGIGGVVGMPRVVAAASRLALALGVSIDLDGESE